MFINGISAIYTRQNLANCNRAQGQAGGRLASSARLIMLLMLLLGGSQLLATPEPASSGLPSIEFMLSLGAVVFLVLFFGLLVWNRNQQRAAQRRTQELLSQLMDSNAQTRDLQTQLTERKQTEEMLLRRGHLKRIIASLSSDFVRLGPDEIDDGIDHTLAVIGEFSDKSRAYVFLVRPDGDTIDNTHEWCKPEVMSYRDDLQGISLEGDVPWFGARIKEFREVHIPSVDELPPEARQEKNLFHLQEIGSIFCVPMVSGNKLRGFLGFDSEQRQVQWPDDIIQLLRIVAEIFTNALDRRRAETTLRESEERFREMADLLPQTIFETDMRMRITYSNRKGFEVTGYSQEDLEAGVSAFELLNTDDRDDARKRFAELVSSESASKSHEFECRRKDCSFFPGMIYSRPILRNGVTIGFRGILIDMTLHKQQEDERRRLESQFLQAQKFESLSVMAGSIAHNFNNLLTVVMGNLEMVISDSPKEASWMEHMIEADRALRRASELSTMLLTYVGQKRMNMEETELNALTSDLVTMLQASLSKDTTIRMNLCSEPCLLLGDSSQVRQVVVNLVNNAAEALIDKSGEIAISTGFMHHEAAVGGGIVTEDMVSGDYVYIEIQDNGIGMDEATVAKVFDPFFTTKFTGRGLGLAAVLGIVRAHHGGIKLTSEPGKGSCIRAMFPRVVREEEIVVVTLPKRSTFRGSGTVLLVDDEAMVLGVGRRMLQRLGFDVLTAEDGEEALEIFREKSDQIRCVLLDLTMPRMDGEQTFREMVSLDPHVRVVVASGYSEEQMSDRFGEQRPVAFIRKPFQMSDLGSKLEEAFTAEV